MKTPQKFKSKGKPLLKKSTKLALQLPQFKNFKRKKSSVNVNGMLMPKTTLLNTLKHTLIIDYSERINKKHSKIIDLGCLSLFLTTWSGVNLNQGWQSQFHFGSIGSVAINGVSLKIDGL